MKSTLELLHPHVGQSLVRRAALRERRAMLGAAELLRLRPGEMLFRQGDRVPPGKGAFYGLVTGSFKISSLREDGKEAILVVLEAGNWFGEISLIDLQPRTHDATAVGEAEVLALPRAAFDELMKRHTFSQAICRMLAARTRSLYGMVEDATLRSTRARVARRLLLLAHGDATQARGCARGGAGVAGGAGDDAGHHAADAEQGAARLLAAHGAISLGYGRIEIELPVLLERLGSAQ